MQSAIKEAMAEFNLEAKDAQFQKLGEAMEMSASMKAASKALKDGEYAKAAKELEKMDAETFKDLTKREKATAMSHRRSMRTREQINPQKKVLFFADKVLAQALFIGRTLAAIQSLGPKT